MPFSSGTFSRLYNWVNEQLSSPIEISKLDAQEEDFATALSNCMLRDGTGLPTAAQDWNGQNLTNVAAFTATGIVTGGRFVPTSSSAPTNGMYLSAANTLGWSTNSVGRLTLDSSGVLALTGSMTISTTLVATGNVTGAALIPTGSTVPTNGLYLSAANTLAKATNSTLRWSVNSTGNHTIAAPSSGTALAVTGVLSGTSFTATDGSRGFYIGHSAGNVTIGTSTGDTLNLASNGTGKVSISTAGNVTINAPSSGASLSVTSVAGGIPIQWNDGTLTGGISLSSSQVQFGATSNHAASFYTNNLTRVSIAAAGNVTINAPDSGVALDVAGNGVNTQISFGAAGTYSAASFNKGALHYNTTGGILTLAARSNAGNTSINFNVSNGGTDRTPLSINNTGNVTIASPASGVGLTVSGGGATITGTVTGTTFSGSGASLTNLDATQLTGTINTARISGSYTGITAIGNATVNDSGGSPFDAGFRDMPQSTNTSLVLTDRGKHIYLTGTTNTVTIPANASVAFPTGSTIVLVNDGSGNTTLNITTDTLAWLQGGVESTGSRTIATKSVVTLVKVTSTRWIISGSGIS